MENNDGLDWVRGLFPDTPHDQVPRLPANPAILEELRAVIARDQASVTWHSDVVEDSDGYPSWVPSPRTIELGTVEGEGEDFPDDDWPHDWDVYGPR